MSVYCDDFVSEIIQMVTYIRRVHNLVSAQL